MAGTRMLTVRQVKTARRRYRKGAQLKSVVEYAGLTRKSVCDMLLGITYADIPGAIKRLRNDNEYLTLADIRWARRQVAGGRSIASVASDLGVWGSTINKALKGHRDLPKCLTCNGTGVRKPC